MFTARCALNTYIKHISFVFKRLIQNSVERVSMKQLTSFVLWRVIPVTAGIVGLNAVERTVSPVKKQQCSSVLVCGSYERVIFLGCTSCKKNVELKLFKLNLIILLSFVVLAVNQVFWRNDMLSLCIHLCEVWGWVVVCLFSGVSRQLSNIICKGQNVYHSSWTFLPIKMTRYVSL